ncbi:MAG: MAPEG family protein [Rhabdaerophilum sp.]
MSLALWMVLLAGLMPYLTVGFAKFSGGRYDNNHPRQWALGLEGYRARAYAAHQNHFEFFPFFAAAVIIAEMRAGSSGLLSGLALAAVAARIGYTACYLTDRATLRSFCWLIGVLCITGLFGLAAGGK